MNAIDLTPLYNWLCSAAQPVFSEQFKRWVRPCPPQEGIAVLHLAASNADVQVDGKTVKLYEVYRRRGLTK